MEAEERGQGEAIARNLMEMVDLKVPVLGIAAIGLAGAYEIYKNQMKAGTAAAGAVAGGLEDE